MLLEPKDVVTKSVATMLEEGFKKGQDSNEFIAGQRALDTQVDLFLQKMFVAGENGPKMLTPKFIDSLNVSEFWSICYVGVSNDLMSRTDGQMSYSMASAIHTYVEAHPTMKDYCIDKPLSLVDITNIIFESEYDMVFANYGIARIFEFLDEQAKQSQASMNSSDYAPVNN